MRYEIWQAELFEAESSHIRLRRCPVVVVSNNAVNASGSGVTVVPLTTKLWQRHLRSQMISLSSGLRSDSFALCDQISSLDRSKLLHYIGYITNPEDRALLDRAMAVQLGIVG